MTDAVIQIKSLGKKYVIGGVKQYDTIRDRIADLFRNPSKSAYPGPKSDTEFWALRDINLEVKQGEVLGIIGRNGAGKSTLLKVISKITEPTEGLVVIRGKVGSLLEVGTGFHPELTGRENIYLNGAILGMTRAEIKNKFNEIVDFSEIGQFIDTPVKHYSSGMYVRLAFAVAAHLEPEILIVDEVLAVGDAEFQKKCLGKMDTIAQSGRTVLFVSHNLNAVLSLCSRCLLLKYGRIDSLGEVNQVIGKYLHREGPIDPEGKIPESSHLSNTGEAKFTAMLLTDDRGQATDEVPYRQQLRFLLALEVFQPLRSAMMDLKIVSQDGVIITYSTNTFEGDDPATLMPGKYRITAKVENALQPSSYTCTLGIHHSSGLTIDYIDGICGFSVSPNASDRAQSYRYPWVHGLVRAGSEWVINPIKG